MAAPDLDRWVANPVIRTRHRRSAAADPQDLWAAAQTVRLRDVGPLGRAVRWRIPGTPAATPFVELFRGEPFVVLDEGPRHLVSGLVGRIWTLERDYPRLVGPTEFAAWDRPRTAKVVFAHWVEPDGGGSALHSEARVMATDRHARLRLRALWALLGGFERMIGGDGLAAATKRA